jgi:hypothetical protein
MTQGILNLAPIGDAAKNTKDEQPAYTGTGNPDLYNGPVQRPLLSPVFIIEGWYHENNVPGIISTPIIL